MFSQERLAEASKDDIRAINDTGYAYYYGVDVAKNIPKAVMYWQKALELGSVVAVMYLGNVYYEADGYIDKEKALKCYTIAANNNYAPAYIKLGLFAYDGTLMERDITKAVEFFKKARDLGENKNAEVCLAYVFARNDVSELPIDVSEEIRELAPFSTSPESQFAMYRLLLRSPDTDIEECKVWLLKSVNGGYLTALDIYAGMWIGDLIQDLDVAEFVEGCQTAAKNGDEFTPQIYYALGHCYLNGEPPYRNLTLAEKYIKLAADAEMMPAMRVLAREYDEDGHFDTNIEALIYYYEKAIAADGDLLSMLLVSPHYIDRRDFSRARMYLERVARGDDGELAEHANTLLSSLDTIENSTNSGHGPYDTPKKSGGCYIATAVYGSYDCPEVWILRRFRDDVLAKTVFGRAFIRAYYAISPSIVKRYSKRKTFNAFWRTVLSRFVDALRKHGFSDSPYED